MELFVFGAKLLFIFIVIYSLTDRICKCFENCAIAKGAASMRSSGKKDEKNEEK